MAERLLYGSDWYMNHLFHADHTRFPHAIRDVLPELLKNSAGLDQVEVERSVMRGGALRWLGIRSPDGTLASLDGHNTRARLWRWYEGATRPDWLR